MAELEKAVVIDGLTPACDDAVTVIVGVHDAYRDLQASRESAGLESTGERSYATGEMLLQELAQRIVDAGGSNCDARDGAIAWQGDPETEHERYWLDHDAFSGPGARA